MTILESTGLGLVSFFLCGVACPAAALSLVRTSTARLVYVTPSGSGNWGVVFGGWAAWTAAVPLWRSAVRAPNLTALGEKGGQCLVAASPVRLHGLVETEFVFKTLMRLLLKQYSGLCFSFPNPEYSVHL